MINIMEKVGSLEEEALKRKERLKNLKRKQPYDIDEETSNPNTEIALVLPKPKFRSYKPQDEILQEAKLKDADPAVVDDEIQDLVEAGKEKENHLPQGISNFLQPNPVQNLHQGTDLNQLRVSDDQFRQNHGNRVFRQESGVGNFGLTPNFPRFNTFGPIYTNRFIPVNRQINFNPDSELKQLLAQNGLNGRAHEDLNIVTKVLSLNHGVPLNNVSNRLPFDTRRHVRTPV